MLSSVPTLTSDEETTPLAAIAVADGRRRLGSALRVAPSGTHLATAPHDAIFDGAILSDTTWVTYKRCRSGSVGECR